MFEELYTSVKSRYGSSSANQSMGDWICENTTIKKRPFSFDGYEFQRAIADDMHPNIAVKKCSQIGLTEVQIRKFLGFLTRQTALAGIFSMPNEKMFTKTYNGRIKPILESDDIFNPPTTIKPTRSKDQIQIRDSFGYITACTEGDATSLSADFLFHDELDLSPQEIIALYQSRIQGSDVQITQSFSTPSFVNYGIDKRYKMSDMREYVMKCGACGHYQIPRFTPKFIHLEDYSFDVENFTDLTTQQISMLNLENCYVKCEQCAKRLDLGDASMREWVPEHPMRQNFRGYQVRPFSTPRLKPAYIFTQLAKYAEDGYLRGFYNTVLGEEYTNADAQVQKADVEYCMARGTAAIPPVSPDMPVFMGIDVGFSCHITLSYDTPEGETHFFLFETVPAAFLNKRVEEIKQIYNVVQGAMDRFPYTQQANDIRDASHGLIVPIQYRGGAALQPVFEPDTKDLSHYSASNTFILDRLHSAFGHRRLILSGYQGQKETVLAHVTDMIRDETPDSEAVWKKNTGSDHYFHSMAFNLLARRVAEHMFATQLSTMAISSSFLGGQIGTGRNSNLEMVNNDKSLNRISRLG
jgi:hypothetical protein